MRYLDRIAALAVISLAACAGRSVAPDLTPAAIAEATKTLESAKPAVERAYEANNHVFPHIIFRAPMRSEVPAGGLLPTVPIDPNAKYVRDIFYNATSAWSASAVVTMTGTGNPNVDGKSLGMFGVGHTDGTVTWMCGTAAAATSTAPSAQKAMWPYLPAACQH